MAMIGKQDIFAEIVIMSIKSWPASQTKLLLAWKDRLRIYKELNAGIDIDDLQKTTLLQVAVQGAPSLACVKDDADILSTQLNKSLTFDEYYQLLKSAAQQFDSLTECNAAGTRKAHRQTLRHDIFEHHTPPDPAGDFSVLNLSYYDVMPTSQQQHQRTTPPADQCPRVCLANDQWKDLEDKALTLWKSISAPNKAIILRYSTMQHPDAQTTQQVHFITSQCIEPDAAEFMVSRAASYHLGEQPLHEDTHTTSSDATWDASTITGSINRTNLKTGDPRKLLSSRLAKPPTGAVAGLATEVTIGGHVVSSFVADNNVMRFQAHNTNVMYLVSRLTHIEPGIDMVDRGANGGVAGSNMRVVFRHPTRSVDIEGYDQHCTTNIPLVTCANVVHTYCGEVVAIYHNYAFTGKGRSIHSVPQLEAYKQLVDDKSVRVCGLQRITTVDGYILPIDIINALPYVKTRA
jgi:hypothetical protein